jgi:hypothetical protein
MNNEDLFDAIEKNDAIKINELLMISKPLDLNEKINTDIIPSLSEFFCYIVAGNTNLCKDPKKFEIKLVKRWSEEIYRTPLSKVPLIRDIF